MSRKRRFARLRARSGRRTRPGAPPGAFSIDPEAPKPVIRAVGYGPDSLEELDVESPSDVVPVLRRNPVTWVNVDGLGDEAVLRELGDVFGLHPLALEDVVHVHQRPKVEPYGDQLFLIARMVRLDSGAESEQVSLFLGDGFVLTFQERPGDVFDPVRQRIRDARPKLRGGGPDYLVYALFDAIIDGYFPVLERFGERLEELEDEVLTRPDEGSLSRVHDVKRDLLALRRAVWPHRDALSSLQREHSHLIREETLLYLRDTYDHTIQIMDLVDNYRELGSGLADLYLSSISHRMNEVMKLLTVMATIFIPLTFIAGVYGMNFDPESSPWNMPELTWYYAYPATLAGMAALALVMVCFFWRKGWLKPLDLGAEDAPAEPSTAREADPDGHR